jgi:hypothetical protein
MAGRRNPETVNGLEIVKCKEGQVAPLSSDEMNTLKHRSVDLDDKIRAMLGRR